MRSWPCCASAQRQIPCGLGPRHFVAVVRQVLSCQCWGLPFFDTDGRGKPTRDVFLDLRRFVVCQELYSQCFDELIRQVTINQPERGLLLLRVRDEIRMSIAAYQTLYQSSVTFGTRKQLQSEQGKAETEQMIAEQEDLKRKREASVVELKNKCEAIERREAERRTRKRRLAWCRCRAFREAIVLSSIGGLHGQFSMATAFEGNARAASCFEVGPRSPPRSVQLEDLACGKCPHRLGSSGLWREPLPENGRAG